MHYKYSEQLNFKTSSWISICTAIFRFSRWTVCTDGAVFHTAIWIAFNAIRFTFAATIDLLQLLMHIKALILSKCVYKLFIKYFENVEKFKYLRTTVRQSIKTSLRKRRMADLKPSEARSLSK
jgi:hypothetical protein